MKIILLISFFALSSVLPAQRQYPEGYFQPPVDSRLLLSGTFGELRSNHFHSGIDIKTGGKTGVQIRAVADGYVSRIKVSAFGFGKALYITHPNGYVSVYGHLDRFNQAIGAYVIQEHYRKENFEIEIFPGPDELPVKKGQVVAFSGNSGSSAGPHLHFELRDEGRQWPINPLLFGYDVPDTYIPVITAIRISPESENTTINGVAGAVNFPVNVMGRDFYLNSARPITVDGDVSFAIQVYDKQNDSDNKNGPYSVSLFIDSELMFNMDLETFSFDHTRYINSLIDYAEYQRNGARYIRTKIDPGNKLEMYGAVKNKGVYRFDSGTMHVVRYEVKDVAGNTSALEFKVMGKEPASPAEEGSASIDSNAVEFRYEQSNHYENEWVRVDAPAGAFYESFRFQYDSANTVARTLSRVHIIHDKYTPVHNPVKLAINPESLSRKLRDKAIVVRINEDGKSFSSEGGQWENDGFVHASISAFGRFAVAVDTIAPVIEPLSAGSYANLAGVSSVKFKISDDLSGIKTYRGTLNGKWILMDYDAKNDLLVYKFDDKIIPGENSFELVVSDAKGNRSSHTAILKK